MSIQHSDFITSRPQFTRGRTQLLNDTQKFTDSQLEQSITALSFQEKLWLLGQIVQQLRSAEPIEPDAAAAETAYLLRSPENARRLLESIAQLEAGQGVEREIIE